MIDTDSLKYLFATRDKGHMWPHVRKSLTNLSQRPKKEPYKTTHHVSRPAGHFFRMFGIDATEVRILHGLPTSCTVRCNDDRCLHHMLKRDHLRDIVAILSRDITPEDLRAIHDAVSEDDTWMSERATALVHRFKGSSDHIAITSQGKVGRRDTRMALVLLGLHDRLTDLQRLAHYEAQFRGTLPLGVLARREGDILVRLALP